MHVYGLQNSEFTFDLVWLNFEFNNSKSSCFMLLENTVFTTRLIQFNFVFDSIGKRARLRVTKLRVHFWFNSIKLWV